MHSIQSLLRSALAVVIALLANLIVIPQASSQTATLVLERSTSGLQGWETVATSPMIFSTTGSANTFFRMRIQHSPALDGTDLISVTGGTFPNDGVSPHAGQTVGSFRLGRYEVTLTEWLRVRDYAAANGYDIDTAGQGASPNAPVEAVTWNAVAKWCNARSEMNGLEPVYKLNGATFKRGTSTPTIDALANGYRLPTSREWEWAFRGGNQSLNYTYSGSNFIGDVAWYGSTFGDAQPVGQKSPNELGFFDMSGNVYEWTQDASSTGFYWNRGGSASASASACTYWARTTGGINTVIGKLGFRIAHNAQ
jgi:sulfatase modifying factor 1